ncbi:hypothetical protein [Pseudoxanthomonas sp.]|jgi:hypothetical protein|uniref:hypothetical protein n=1 Tax=Pseudoxanthomonas sp. TaxID=1871049 RepID=UPI002FE11F56
MRTLIFIAVGLLLVGIAMSLASPGKRRTVMVVLSVGWLAAVLWNLRTGMSHGYSLQEELPIQAGIYLVPVAAGWWWAWKTRQR